jgi:hypothetical protein
MENPDEAPKSGETIITAIRYSHDALLNLRESPLATSANEEDEAGKFEDLRRMVDDIVGSLKAKPRDIPESDGVVYGEKSTRSSRRKGGEKDTRSRSERDRDEATFGSFELKISGTNGPKGALRNRASAPDRSANDRGFAAGRGRNMGGLSGEMSNQRKEASKNAETFGGDDDDLSSDFVFDLSAISAQTSSAMPGRPSGGELGNGGKMERERKKAPTKDGGKDGKGSQSKSKKEEEEKEKRYNGDDGNDEEEEGSVKFPHFQSLGIGSTWGTGSQEGGSTWGEDPPAAVWGQTPSSGGSDPWGGTILGGSTASAGRVSTNVTTAVPTDRLPMSTPLDSKGRASASSTSSQPAAAALSSAELLSQLLRPKATGNSSSSHVSTASVNSLVGTGRNDHARPAADPVFRPNVSTSAAANASHQPSTHRPSTHLHSNHPRGSSGSGHTHINANANANTEGESLEEAANRVLSQGLFGGSGHRSHPPMPSTTTTSAPIASSSDPSARSFLLQLLKPTASGEEKKIEREREKMNESEKQPPLKPKPMPSLSSETGSFWSGGNAPPSNSNSNSNNVWAKPPVTATSQGPLAPMPAATPANPQGVQPGNSIKLSDLFAMNKG